MREVPTAILIAVVLGLFCALAASALQHGSDTGYSKAVVAIVDEEGSFASGVAVSMITGQKFMAPLEVVKTTKEKAEAGLEDGTYSAAVFLPAGFSNDVSRGIKAEAKLVVAENAPLQGDVLKLLASFGEDLLSTGQFGVFAGENLVLQVDPSKHGTYLTKSNTAFIAKAMSDPQIQKLVLQYGQTGVSSTSWYLLIYAMTFFSLMILGCFFASRDANTSMLRRLWAGGVSDDLYLGSKLLWIVVFYLILTAVMLTLGAGFGYVSLSISGVLGLMVALAALILMGMALIVCLPESMAVTAVTVMSLTGLFACGGILPRLELPELVTRIGDLLPTGCAARAASLLVGGTFQPVSWILCLAWGAGAYVLMRLHLVKVRKGAEV